MKMKNITEVLKKNTMVFVLILVYLFFSAMTQGQMFSPLNFMALVSQNAYVYVLAIGMLICMLTGGNIDLSCGSFVCFLGAIGGICMVIHGMSIGLSISVMLLVGIIYGAVLGFVIAYMNIPPWIATLAGFLAFRGLGTSLLSASSSTGSIAPFPKAFLKIFSGKLFETPFNQLNIPCIVVGIVASIIIIAVNVTSRANRIKKGYEVGSATGMIVKTVASVAVVMLFAYKLAMSGGIPTVLVWVTVIVLIYQFLTSNVVTGRYFYTVGGNAEATRLSGVNTKHIMFLAYLNMAILTVVSACMIIARFQAANSTAGTNYEMDAISACVVGGVSAYGGSGTVFGMVIGATLIGVINLGMSLMGVDANWQKVIKGVVLLAAVVFEILNKKNKGKD